MIFKNCTFINELFEKEFGDIKVENGKISEIGFFSQDGIDMSSKIILPGFVDIHIHGGAGADFSDGTVKSYDTISRYLAKHGVTSFCGTAMTLGYDALSKAVKTAAGYVSPASKLCGINLEGPYIAMSKRGAQNAEYIRPGNIDEINSLFEICNKIKLITIAPEAFDSDLFIREISKKITVSIGHSTADAVQCERAFEMGASHVTHLFNAMTPMTQREAGIVGTALDNDNVTCELICDCEHICPAVLRNAFDILKSDRACVVSDSMRGAGLGCGEFELGGQMTYVKEGDRVARLADGTIAASVTNVFDEFKNLLSIGIDFKTALKSCTINPAKVIGEQSNIGSIAKGKCADFTVCDENLEIQEVYINGILT